MPNILDYMDKEARKFMEKRKKIEEKRKKEMLDKNDKMFKELIAALTLVGTISISFLPNFINNELKPIVDKYRNEQNLYVDSFIRDDYRIGIEEGQKLLQLANEKVDPNNGNISDSEYEEVLIALLLYAERIIDNQHESLLNNLNRDITSIYISNKNLSNKDVEKDTETKDNSTLNTILTGALIAKYIYPTFKNINNRTNMTAQNETNRALNHGIMMRYLIARRDNFPGLMVKWIDVKDERECHYCREAANGGDLGHGIYRIDEITPPPLHSRCRCILIPYLERWGEY